jgi:hypothetical protein
MTEVDLQPETPEVLQSEDDGDPVLSVHVSSVKTPVRTQPLPLKAGSTRYRQVTTTAIKVLAADHFRGLAYIVAFDQDMFVAFNAASATDTSRMSRWPALVPFPHICTTDLWVSSFQATTNISITTGLWATGD